MNEHWNRSKDKAQVFHELVSKEELPVYYEHIQQPVALSTIREKLDSRQYKNLADFKV